MNRRLKYFILSLTTLSPFPLKNHWIAFQYKCNENTFEFEHACLVGGLVSHVLHHGCKVPFEAMHWSVMSPTPPFLLCKPKIYSFFSSKEWTYSLSGCLLPWQEFAYYPNICVWFKATYAQECTHSYTGNTFCCIPLLYDFKESESKVYSGDYSKCMTPFWAFNLK